MKHSGHSTSLLPFLSGPSLAQLPSQLPSQFPYQPDGVCEDGWISLLLSFLSSITKYLLFPSSFSSYIMNYLLFSSDFHLCNSNVTDSLHDFQISHDLLNSLRISHWGANTEAEDHGISFPDAIHRLSIAHLPRLVQKPLSLSF